MRHRQQKKHFNRDANHRKMLIRNLVRSLVEHGAITTTEAKAKETKRWVDRLISRASDNTVETRRILHRFFGKRDVVNTLVDKIAPAMGKRQAGFTSIVRLGKRRGDNVELVKLSLVAQPKEIGTLKSGVDHSKKKPAKKKKKISKPTKKSVKKLPTKKVVNKTKKKVTKKK